MSGWARWWPVTGLVFVALWVVCAFLSDDVPDTNDDDATITAYFQKNSHQDKAFLLFLLVGVAALIFIWFLANLRERLFEAEGGARRLTALAFGAGLCGVALWLVYNALQVGAGLSADDTDKFKLDPNTFRILSNIGYITWTSGTTVVGFTIVATALVSLRSGLLPKWLAWLSFPVAASLLVSFFFFPFLILLGWVLVVSVTLMVRPSASQSVPAGVAA